MTAMRRIARRCLSLFLASLVIAPLRAETAIDPLSLGIESQTPAGDTTDAAHAGLSVESWLQGYAWRGRPSAPDNLARLVLDVRHEWTLAPEWRASFSNRLESARALDGERQTELRNALREGFVTWRNDFGGNSSDSERPAGVIFVDAGRINQRLGVASGYNPTDYFRGGAVVSSVSQNPATLRQNRLGTFATRAQWLSAGQSWSAAWVPQLTERNEIDTSDFALGVERTNRQQAFLLRWAPKIGERVSLDIPVLARESRIETGLNATALIGDALVASLELSTARRETLPDAAQAQTGQTPNEARALRLAAGGTWTAESGISLTLERHYAGDALSKKNWNNWLDALRQPGAAGGAATAAYGRLAAELAYRQDLLVRDMWFARVGWDDAFQLRGFNLAAFMRVNAYDRSRSWQAEAAWNDRRDWSLRVLVGGNGGDEFSEFGRRSQRGYGAVSLTLYW